MKKFTVLAMFIALVSSFSLRANEIIINRMHIWKDGVATSYLVEADLDSITFSQEIIQDDETNLPEVANPGTGKTTVVLYVPEDTPAGCYAVGPINGWNVQNTQFMFSAVETATNPRWVAYTFDWTEDLTIKVLAIPSDPTVALGWNFQWAKNRDPENDLTEDNVVILQGEGMFKLENQGEPRLIGLADGGVCYIHVKAWANTPVIKHVPCETAAFKHPWGGGEWVYREATKTAEATFELNARYGNTGFCVATDVNGSGENWYPDGDIAFVGDVAKGDSVNVKFVSEKGTVGELTVTLIEKAGPVDQPEAEGIGVFSIGEGKTVTFSPGNLQYHPANDEWRFAEHQWDYVGGSNEGNVYEDGVKSNNALISPSYDGWIDLFGWGTGDNPTNSSMFNTDFVSFVDWGINKIGNDAPNTWRTLTNEEWSYLRYNRTNADDLVAVAKVNGVNGLIILPDNWVCPNNITFKPGFSYNDSNAAYGDYQVFTLEEWLEMESNGALFLPATGYGGDEIQSVQGSGAYWSSTEHDAARVYYLYFYSFESHTRYADRCWGNSVRLVKDVEGETTNTENGHEYVDLGLSVKWATCNVGATKPEEYGDYFAWGEVEPKDYYDWSNYKWCNGSYTTLTKYNHSSSYGTVDNKTTLELSDDAARANWGGSWRMPTDAEMTELRENCTWTWTSKGSVNGYQVTGPNGNSIFLPAAGDRTGSLLVDAGGHGSYWSSSLNTDYPDLAYELDFYSPDYVSWYYGSRFYGQSVRPVCDEQSESPSEPESPSEGIGVFSVGEGKTVTFSRGNLLYHPANNVWQFAENQTDYIGDANSNISSTYNGWLDLFGWSTAATNFGVSTSMDNNDYSGSFVDWGTNKIGNDAPNTWRTLTYDEWDYLLYNRTNANDLVGVAQVNGVNGLIFLPDNWTCPAGVTFKSGFYSEYSVEAYGQYQTFSADQWSKLESAGAVFLPASGNRGGSNVNLVQNFGRYWSATEYDGYSARSLYFDSFEAGLNFYDRYDGHSVRLVKDVEAESGTPDTTSFPLISTVPEVIPMGYDGEVTIIFNPNEGNKGMQDASACYAHTGLITSASINDGDWQNVVENWRENTSKTQLTKDGNNWKLVISNIYDFYGCPADTEIKKLAFVFHDGPGGSREGKTAEGMDIFVVLEEVEEPETPVEPESPSEPASGVFSVSATKQVTFSPGNLQYHPANNVWQFAANQTDYVDISSRNDNISATYDGWIDGFGWGTGDCPMKASEDDNDYQTFVDWGTNQIGNDAPNTWRTLTKDEWKYIFYNRPNAQSLFALGSVNGVNGTIILPDNWTTPDGVSFVASTTKGLYWNGSYYNNGNADNYSHNTYTSEQWSQMEQAGAVFLPADDDYGPYWSSTGGSESSSYILLFCSYYLDPQDRGARYGGCSVRLVKDVEGESDTPTTPNNPEEPTDPDETEGANDYMLDNFKIGGYGFFDLGDPIAGTDTLFTLSTGDEVTCQLAPSIAYVWDDGITWGNSGLTGAGYIFSVENYVYAITDSPNGIYNGYFIIGDAITGFGLAVDTIASEEVLPYTGKAGQLLDVDMYGDAWDSLYNLAEDTIDEEYYNAIMDKYYAAQTGTQFYYYDFNADAQNIYSGNVSYLYLKEDNQTGELYYDLKLEWYDNVNEGRSYGLLAETEVNEEGKKIITGIVKPYDMRFIHKHYQQLPSTEELPTEAPARVQAKAEVRAIYDF